MKNTNNAKTRVYREISDQIYQTIDYVFNGALGNFYRVIFQRAFEKMPFFTLTFILSLLKITTAQYKIYAIDLSKKEFEQHSKIIFIQELAKRLTKTLEMNVYETFTEDVPEAEKKQCEKLTKDFIKKLEKKLEKLLTPKKVKTSDVKEVQEVQEVHEVHEEQQAQVVESTSEEPKVVEVKNLPLEQQPENVELLRKFAQICLDYTHKNVWGASKKQDEMLNSLKEKWNLPYDEIFKLSNPYYDKLVDEYHEEKKRKEREAEEAKQRLEAMKLKSSDVRMLNFAVSILIKDKQKLQFNLGQLYEESDHMEFTEKQIAINNCKIDLNEAQELITKILSLRNAGYVPQYYESKYDSEEDKQIATEAWANFLAKDIYDPSNKEESLANLKLIFNKLRKF